MAGYVNPYTGQDPYNQVSRLPGSDIPTATPMIMSSDIAKNKVADANTLVNNMTGSMVQKTAVNNSKPVAPAPVKAEAPAQPAPDTTKNNASSNLAQIKELLANKQGATPTKTEKGNGGTTEYFADGSSKFTPDKVTAVVNPTQPGETTPPVTGETKTPEQISIDKANADYQKTLDEKTANAQKQIEDIKNGVFNLTPDEQAQVDNLQKTYQKAIEQMKDYNMRYEQGLTILGQATGQSRYTTGTQMATMNDAIQKGTDRVTNLETEMVSKVADLKTALRDKDYESISKLYDTVLTNQDEKRKTLTDMQQKVADTYQTVQKQHEEAQKEAENNQKLFTSSLPFLSTQLTGDPAKDDAKFKEWSKTYNLDVNLLKGLSQSSINKNEEAITKQDKDMSVKGYRTISPLDVQKQRQLGNDVTVINGRAYMKPSKTTTKTIKVGSGKTGQTYNVTYDQYGKEVKRERMGGYQGASTGTVNKANASEKTAINDMAEALKSVSGKNGFVSPQDHEKYRKMWIDKGYNVTTFDTKFRGYKDPNNTNYVTTKTPKAKSNRVSL